MYALAIAPTGDRIACGGEDGLLRVYSLPGLALIGELPGHRAWISACAFSGDGRTLCSAGYDGQVLSWDLEGDGDVGRVVVSTPDPIFCLAVDGPTESICFGGEGRELLDAPIDGSRPPRRRTVHGDDVMCCVVAADGAVFSSGRDGVLRRSPPPRASAHDERPETGHDTEVGCCAVAADGRWFVSGEGPLALGGIVGVVREDARPEVRVWDRDGALVHTLSGHQERITACRFDPTGDTLVTADVQGRLTVWSTSPLSRVIDGQGWFGSIEGVEFSGDRRWLAIMEGHAPRSAVVRIHDLTASELDLSSGGGVASLSGPGRRYSAATFTFSELVVGTTGGTIEVWRHPWTEPALVSEHPGRGAVRGVAVAPDGAELVAGFEDGSGVFLNTHRSDTVADHHLHDGPVVTCRFTEDGATLMTAGEDGTVRLWAWPSCELTGLLPLNGRAMCADITPTEPLGCAGATSGALYLFSVGGRSSGR